MTDPIEAAPGDRRRTADAVAAAAVAVAAGLLALKPAGDPDLFFHLAVGRHVATIGAVPDRNLWSFTAPEHPFNATSWLFGLVAHALERTGGFAAIQLATALACAAAFVLAYAATRRRGATPAWAAAFVLAAVAASQFRFLPRPHVVSYALLALVGLLLHEARQTRRLRRLAAVPPLVALWSNLHAGAIFGVAAVACFAAAEGLDRVLGRRPDEPSPRLAVLAAAVALACVVALVANPSGGYVFTYVVRHHLGEVGLVAELQEFLTPSPRAHGAYWALLVVALGAVAARGRRVDLFDALLTIGFAVVSVRALRVAPKFLILAIPVAAAWGPALARDAIGRRVRWRPGPGARRWLAAAGLVGPGLALVAALAASPRPLDHFVRRIRLGPDPYRVPLAAAAFARDHGVAGRCFTSFDLGGFVAWALPESSVFHDPRILAYPPWVYADLDRAERDPAAFDALMDRFGVEWSLRSHAVMRLSGIGRLPKERWALVYWDEAAAVRVRRDLPRFAALVRDLEIREFVPGARVPELWRAATGEARRRLVSEMRAAAERSPNLAAAQIGLCMDAAGAGDLALARTACARAAAAVREKERLHPFEVEHRREDAAMASAFLGEAIHRSGDTAGARAAFRDALALAPRSAWALAGLGWTYVASDPSTARDLFQRALESVPEYGPARAGLARIDRGSDDLR